MRKKYDAVATTGKYKDGQGNEKKRYTNVGTVFEDDNGRLWLKLDCVPVTPEWSGWIAFYDPNDGAATGRRRGNPVLNFSILPS